jgi:tetratricopeptide (TPR) repeat protein
MKRTFLITILIAFFINPAQAKEALAAKTKIVCKDYFNLLFNVQDMDKVIEQSAIIAKSKDAMDLPCYWDAKRIMELAMKYFEVNNEPLKLFLLAHCRTHQNWPQPVPGAELTAKPEEPLYRLITFYPEHTLVPQAYFMLAGVLDEQESLRYFMILADKYKNARAEWSYMGRYGIAIGQNLAGTGLFLASDIYQRMGNLEKAVECLNRIINEYGNEKDYNEGAFNTDAYVQLLHLYTGRHGDMEIPRKYEKEISAICKIIIGIPSTAYLTRTICCSTVGNTHAEAYMTLAKIENDKDYYKKTIIEYGDVFNGIDGSDEGNTYGYFASDRLDKMVTDIDSRILLYKEIAEKTASRYMQAEYRSRLAGIYMNDKKDLNSALVEYKYIAENLKGIPYYDPEALGDGKGFSDTAKDMIKKINELIK